MGIRRITYNSISLPFTFRPFVTIKFSLLLNLLICNVFPEDISPQHQTIDCAVLIRDSTQRETTAAASCHKFYNIVREFIENEKFNYYNNKFDCYKSLFHWD